MTQTTLTPEAALLLAACRVEMPELFEDGEAVVEPVGDGFVLLFQDPEAGASFAWGIALNGLVQITDDEAAYVEAFGAEWVEDCGFYFG